MSDTTAHDVKLELGQAAPDFDLPTADGGRVTLADLRGAPALIWFYPAASTPTCTKEACDLRDNYAAFTAKGYRVLGISPDPIEKIATFAETQDLPYRLASDESKDVLRSYGAWGTKNMYGRITEGVIRSTFAIDADGLLTYVRYRVSTPQQIEQLQAKLGL